MQINQVFSFQYDFGKRERDACVNSRGMNAMFHISSRPDALQLS